MKTSRQRFSFLSRFGRSTALLKPNRPESRRLRFESLEDRRMLAVFAVSNLNDAGAGSLRAAIDDANNSGGADEVAFVGAATSGVLGLTSGELEITEALTINGPGQGALTIDAQQNSRIFDITATTGDFTLAGLTLTGGRTIANSSAGRGGAVRSLTNGSLIVDQSTISGNSTTGSSASGGGIFSSSDVTLTNSIVSENISTGGGGGIFSINGAVTLTSSTVSGNSTTGSGNAVAGGIRTFGTVSLTNSTVSGNSTVGNGAQGSGI